MEKIEVLTVRPELILEWDFEKNNKLGLNIYKMTKGMDRKAWWICPKCESSYLTRIDIRAKGNDCSYCAGRKVNKTNSLASLNPELASQWHPTKNGDLTPHDVMSGSKEYAWWLGKCGHEWEAMINSRNRGSNCPYCSNRVLLLGFNDMWATNPELASLLLNPEDGYRYMQGSGERLSWRCKECKEIVKNRKVCIVNLWGLSCPKCSDNISFGEKVVYNVFKQLEIEFEKEKVFNWSDRKRYDYYIPLQNMIIEIHGEQHYGKSFDSRGGFTLQEEQENDRYKEQLAKENSIEHYIVIDCRKSEINWIKNSLLNSSLNTIMNLDKVNWEECSKYARKSLVIEVCEYWKNKSQPSTTLLADKFKLSQNTIVSYLKQGKENGWCDYDTLTASSRASKTNKRNSRTVCQLRRDNSFVKEWSSITEASKYIGLKSISPISEACRNINKTSGDFKWMYKEDYDKLIKSK